MADEMEALHEQLNPAKQVVKVIKDGMSSVLNGG